MLEILAYLSGILGVVASLIEILQFLKILKKTHKVVVIVIASTASIVCFSTWYLIDTRRETIRIEEIKNSMTKQDAKKTADTIIITGYESGGDFVAYLIQITGFYGRHKEMYNVEYEMYRQQLETWIQYFDLRSSKNESVYSSDWANLKGLVSGGRDHLYRISSQ